MNFLVLYAILATATVLTWVPLAARFYKFWLNRHNPESLAICLCVVLICWEVGARVWVVADLVNQSVVAIAITGVSLLVGIFFHVAVSWTKKKFPQRKE